MKLVKNCFVQTFIVRFIAHYMCDTIRNRK